MCGKMFVSDIIVFSIDCCKQEVFCVDVFGNISWLNDFILPYLPMWLFIEVQCARYSV